MAVLFPAAQLIKRVAVDLRQQALPKTLLSFSNQDFLLSDAQWIELLGTSALKKLHFRKDSASIVRWHKCAAYAPRIPDSHGVYRRLGFDAITDADLVRARGTEVIADLNYPLPEELSQYAFVLDNVSQHCFNVGQAMQSIAKCVLVGGYVLHILPLTSLNQGYFVAGPAALHDFYTLNGFEPLEHTAHYCDRGTGEITTIPVTCDKRMVWPGDNYFQLFLAQRKHSKVFEWPKQQKFIRMPNSTVE